MWLLTGPWLYLAAAVFAGGALWKVTALARLPRHLRWELYPLPRRGREGSKYQQVDFAALPRHAHRMSEVAFMAEEILALKKVFAGRRDLWLGSWLLHAGLYLGIVFLGLIAAGAVAILLGPAVPVPADSAVPRLLGRAASAVGLCSLLAGTAGTMYLVCLRLVDRGLRAMSDPVTFFNLALLAALFGSGLWAWWSDPGCLAARGHLVSLFRGRPATVESPGLAAALVVGGLFAAYLPFGRMFHAAAKYFFYHAVLWDDEPMRPGSRMEREIAAQLGDPLTWTAPHIRSNQDWHAQLEGEADERAATPGN
jgi:nitrate reductase gamma subunit